MTEIKEAALVESRTLRQQYATRTDVLDKVKALALLPDGVHVTTEMLATYYEVSVDAVESLARRNAEELYGNGRRVLKGAELREFEAVNMTVSKRQALAVYPRRAILNVGQLLRDSEVARRVREYLLDAEASEVSPRSVDEDRMRQLDARASDATHTYLESDDMATLWDCAVEEPDDDGAVQAERKALLNVLCELELLQHRLAMRDDGGA